MRWMTNKENSVFSLRYLPILALGVIVLVVSVPLMTNYCIDGVNVSFYLGRLESVCPEDIFLLLPALAVRAGIQTETVYKLVLFGLNFLTAVIAYLCFCGIFQDRTVAGIGSMLYTWAPYRLNDLYCRADLGEAIALSFLPVVFYGLYLLYEGDADFRDSRRIWIVPALGYTLLFQAYLLSFLVIAGFTALLGIMMWRKTFQKSTLFILLKTAAAFLIANAWLLFLLFRRICEGSFSMAAFRGERIQSGGIFFSTYFQLFFLNGSSFRTAGTGTEHMQPQGVGFAVTVGVLCYLWLAFIGRYRDREDDGGIRHFGKGMGIAGAVIAVMATNSFPWDYVQSRNGLFFYLVESLQSPARLIQVVTVCFTLLVCTALWEVKKWEKHSVGLAAFIVIAMLALVSTQYLTGDILRTGAPRSLYGIAYGEPEGEERLLPENLDISPWDYGKYESAERK